MMKLKITVLSLLAISLIVFLSTLGMLYAKQYSPQTWLSLTQDDLSRDDAMRFAYQRFLHASNDEQDDIIDELALEIQTKQWNLLLEDELSDTFDAWWMSRLKNVDTYDRTGYQMMGYRSYHCASGTWRIPSFAWYYMHSTLDEQHEMDLLWIHTIHDIDTTQSLEDIRAFIDDYWTSWRPNP